MKIADEIKKVIEKYGVKVVGVASKYQKGNTDWKQLDKEIVSAEKLALKEILKLIDKENEAMRRIKRGEIEPVDQYQADPNIG